MMDTITNFFKNIFGLSKKENFQIDEDRDEVCLNASQSRLPGDYKLTSYNVNPSNPCDSYFAVSRKERANDEAPDMLREPIRTGNGLSTAPRPIPMNTRTYQRDICDSKRKF